MRDSYVPVVLVAVELPRICAPFFETDRQLPFLVCEESRVIDYVGVPTSVNLAESP